MQRGENNTREKEHLIYNMYLTTLRVCLLSIVLIIWTQLRWIFRLAKERDAGAKIRSLCLRIAEWRWLFSSRGIGIIHVFRMGIQPMCFSAIRSSSFPFVIVVNCSRSRCARGRNRTKQQRLNDSTQTRPLPCVSLPTYSPHLFASLFAARPFVPSAHFQALPRHSPELRLTTINETKARALPMG